METTTLIRYFFRYSIASFAKTYFKKISCLVDKENTLTYLRKVLD